LGGVGNPNMGVRKVKDVDSKGKSKGVRKRPVINIGAEKDHHDSWGEKH